MPCFFSVCISSTPIPPSLPFPSPFLHHLPPSPLPTLSLLAHIWRPGARRFRNIDILSQYSTQQPQRSLSEVRCLFFSILYLRCSVHITEISLRVFSMPSSRRCRLGLLGGSAVEQLLYPSGRLHVACGHERKASKQMGLPLSDHYRYGTSAQYVKKEPIVSRLHPTH